jgi:hypothetical protein
MAENQGQAARNTPTRHVAATLNDVTVLDPRPTYIVCLTAGNLVVDDELNVSVTYPMVVGQRLEFRAKRLKATGSTGTYALQY